MPIAKEAHKIGMAILTRHCVAYFRCLDIFSRTL